MRILGDHYTSYKYNQPSRNLLADFSIQFCDIAVDVLDELL